MPSEDTPLRKCSTCPNSYPATTEFFHRNARKKDGLNSVCKNCVNTRTNKSKSRPEYKEHAKAYNKERNQRPDVKERNRINERAWRRTPKGQAYYKNHDKVRGPILRRRPEKRAYQQAYNQAYYSKNRERIKANARAYASSLIGQEHRRNAHKRRRARKRNALGTHTEKDMLRIYKAQKGKCYWCGKKIKWTERHDDHITPLSRGGSGSADNMCVSCVACNLSKHSKLPHEWTPKHVKWRLL